MKLIQWINFEKEGEKSQLIEIMNSDKSPNALNLEIQNAFELTPIEAMRVIEIYNSRKINK